MSPERAPNDRANDPAYATSTRQGRIVKGGVMLHTLIISMIVLVVAFLVIAAIW